MNEYVRYYHDDRTHLALEKGTPAARDRCSIPLNVMRSEPGSRSCEFVDWLTIPDRKQAVIE